MYMVEVAENRPVSLISNTFLPCSQCGVDGVGWTLIARNKSLVYVTKFLTLCGWCGLIE